MKDSGARNSEMGNRAAGLLRHLMKRGVVFAVFALMFCLCMPGVRTQAAGKVVKVTSKRTYNKLKEKMTVKGLDKKGKTVWKYTTGSYPATELNQTYCIEKGSRVYVFESGKLIAFKKSTGKKIWTRKNITGAGFQLYIDSAYNIYVTGYYDNIVYKINSKGKVVWKTNISKTNNYWPYKVKLKNGKLTILYDQNSKDSDYTKTHKVIFNAKTGKIIKYY